MNYRLVQADRKIAEKNDLVEEKQRYYLKPPISMKEPIDQRFGNITLELVLINHTPSYLKIVAATYQDHLYQAALNYEDLVDHLFAFDL